MRILCWLVGHETYPVEVRTMFDYSVQPLRYVNVISECVRCGVKDRVPMKLKLEQPEQPRVRA